MIVLILLLLVLLLLLLMLLTRGLLPLYSSQQMPGEFGNGESQFCLLQLVPACCCCCRYRTADQLPRRVAVAVLRGIHQRQKRLLEQRMKLRVN